MKNFAIRQVNTTQAGLDGMIVLETDDEQEAVTEYQRLNSEGGQFELLVNRDGEYVSYE